MEELLRAPWGSDARSRILRSAAELIAERGWGEVRTRAVAERAGVNNALIHYYFRTKQALLVEAAVAAFVAELGPATAGLMEAPGLMEALSGLLRGMAEVDLASPGMRLLAEVLVQATRDPEMRARMAEFLDEFRSLVMDRVRQGQDLGEVDRTVDPEAVAIVLAALLDGLLFHRLIDPGLDVGAPARLLADLLQPAAGRRRGAGRTGRKTR